MDPRVVEWEPQGTRTAAAKPKQHEYDRAGENDQRIVR
jgi:hypothetical protein